MITKDEYKFVVDMFLTNSPYCRKVKREKKDIIIDFLGDFLKQQAFLMKKDKIYKNKELSKLVRKFNNGVNYEENGENFKCKVCVDWKLTPYIKADLIFYSYICKNYDFKIKKTHSGIELTETENFFTFLLYN